MTRRMVSVILAVALAMFAAPGIIIRAESSDIDLTIMVTRELHGAVHPLDANDAVCEPAGSECGACLGGAAR